MKYLKIDITDARTLQGRKLIIKDYAYAGTTTGLKYEVSEIQNYTNETVRQEFFKTYEEAAMFFMIRVKNNAKARGE